MCSIGAGLPFQPDDPYLAHRMTDQIIGATARSASISTAPADGSVREWRPRNDVFGLLFEILTKARERLD
jgi:hypothetical protein